MKVNPEIQEYVQTWYQNIIKPRLDFKLEGKFGYLFRIKWWVKVNNLQP